MKEQLILYETAELAKDKGFVLNKLEEREIGYYYNKHSNKLQQDEINYKHPDILSASTQSLLQKWLREEHRIHVLIMLYDSHHYYNIYKSRKHIYATMTSFVKYEEALETGLIEGLKLITV